MALGVPRLATAAGSASLAAAGLHAIPHVARRARVLLVDDHDLLREGLEVLIDLEADMEVTRGAGSLAEAVAAVHSLEPDLILTDVRLPDASGSQAVVQLREHCPRARIVVLTEDVSEECIRAALLSGADGYILKDVTRVELIRGLRLVLSGQRHLCPRSAARVVRSYLGVSPPDPQHITGMAHVTTREREILSMVARGQSNKRIAVTLNRSVKTVEKHRANLMRKLELHNVADVTRFAIQSGLLRIDSESERANDA